MGKDREAERDAQRLAASKEDEAIQDCIQSLPSATEENIALILGKYDYLETKLGVDPHKILLEVLVPARVNQVVHNVSKITELSNTSADLNHILEQKKIENERLESQLQELEQHERTIELRKHVHADPRDADPRDALYKDLTDDQLADLWRDKRNPGRKSKLPQGACMSRGRHPTYDRRVLLKWLKKEGIVPDQESHYAHLPLVAPPPANESADDSASRNADVLMTDAPKPVPDCPSEMWDCDYIPNQDVDNVNQLLEVVAKHDANNSYLADPNLFEDPALCLAVAKSLSPSPPADAAKDVDLEEGLELLREAAEKGDGATKVMLDAFLSNIAALRAERAKRAEEEVSELLRSL